MRDSLGCRQLGEIQAWAEVKLDRLRRYVRLVNGVPSHDTFGRRFAALDAQQFEACFMRWVANLRGAERRGARR
ncbi:transposase family protein [Paraburkholderia aromaticivorans]|uniref:transposase family protein n=1 Tax=Paraburkholderia aromaticivorans TaxID=2026199 RepID=UPI0032174625